jgi:outer membrane protein TolC
MGLSSRKIPFIKMKVLTRRPNELHLRALVITAGLIAVWCSRAAGQEQVDSLVLGPEEAVTFALERNLLLKGARLGPQIAAWEVRAANAAWLPHLSGRAGVADSRTPPLTVFDPQPDLGRRQTTTGAAITQALPWGSSYSVEWDAERLTGNSPIVRFNPQLTTRGTLIWTQHLLRGLTIDEARANRLISLKGQTVSEAELASNIAATRHAVLQAYWTWIYAREYLAVEQRSLGLAQSLLREDRERAALGKIAAVDVVEAEAEVARRSDVILSGTKDVANAQDQVRLLIFAPGDPEQSRPLAPPPDFGGPDLSESVPAEMIAQALESRQDLRVLQAYLDIDDVTVRRLRNERLPAVALSLSYTSQGVAGTGVPSSLGNTGPALGPRGFSSALGDLVHFRYPGWSAELSVSMPIGNSLASAEAAKASLKRTREETTLRSAEQRVATEVSSVIRDVEANRQRLPLTANAVTLAERRLDAEQRKLVVGLSTGFLVFQAQRDLTTAREGQVKSVLDYRLSLADLQAAGTISVRR